MNTINKISFFAMIGIGCSILALVNRYLSYSVLKFERNTYSENYFLVMLTLFVGIYIITSIIILMSGRDTKILFNPSTYFVRLSFIATFPMAISFIIFGFFDFRLIGAAIFTLLFLVIPGYLFYFRLVSIFYSKNHVFIQKFWNLREYDFEDIESVDRVFYRWYRIRFKHQEKRKSELFFHFSSERIEEFKAILAKSKNG